MRINENYKNLKESYLFSEIAARVEKFKSENPDKKIIRMGIGDVTLPLPQVVVEAGKKAFEEQAFSETFHGYGPEQGYDFLREAIRDYYKTFGVSLHMDEIFVSDGAKSDVGNVLDLFDKDNTVLIPNPVYPVYFDTNVMNGRKIIFAEGNKENNFLPMPSDEVKADIIYLCSPNNPTGAVYTKEQLEAWVKYALKNESIILFDSAYEAFIQDEKLPRSIFSIEGADKCAIEFCSLSKTAGFTGVRCGYTVVPEALEFDGMSLRKMWLRRQTTKFNGVSYPVQRAAQAVFSKEGIEQCRKNIAYYMENAKIITATMDKLNISYVGGENSPYVWLKCPGGMTSWEFFDKLLSEAAVVGTPGSGFGTAGEGYFRLTAFSSKEAAKEAMERLEKIF